MSQQRRRRRAIRLSLLGVAAVIGLGIVTGGDNDDAGGAALEIRGSGHAGGRAGDRTTGAAGAGSKSTDAVTPAKAATAAHTLMADFDSAAAEAEISRSPVLVGDELLRGLIDLRKMIRDGDHFEVPLAHGRRAILTLDPEIEDRVQYVLAQSRAPLAAIVVMAPDGRILALGGRKGGTGPKDGDLEAYDLCSKVWAPAASVFKIVTTTALLRSGVSPTDQVCYHGGLRSVVESNLEDSRRDNRCQDLSYGVAESQNAIIAKFAHRHLDQAKFEKAVASYGLGSPRSCALAIEPSDIDIPDDTDELGQARFAAGFAGSRLSTMDGALLADTVASGGLQPTPRIVAEVVDADGTHHKVVGAAPRRAVSAHVAHELRDMMIRTVASGTAARAFHGRHVRRSVLTGMPIAGKTGSLDRDEPSYIGYSWFVGFAPADHPQVAIAVLLGNAERWWLKAHTAARMVLETAVQK